MNKTIPRAFFGAAIGMLSSFGASAADCSKLSASVKEAVTAKPSDLLAIVESKVSANSGCACEVVKSAIEASHADAATVAVIVQTASTAAPDQMRLIAQCSLAAAPDAVSNVQAVLAKLDPATGGGEHSAKEAGIYVWAKDVRLGEAIATSNPEHYKVIDIKGTHIGDLHASKGNEPLVRATATGGGSFWVYAAIVPVPGEGWIRVAGGIRTLRHADNLGFYLQYEDSLYNPLNFPGQGPGAPDVQPGLPPGPSSGTPPTPPEVPTPTTDPDFNQPTVETDG